MIDGTTQQQDYIIPAPWAGKVQQGTRVRIPVGGEDKTGTVLMVRIPALVLVVHVLACYWGSLHHIVGT